MGFPKLGLGRVTIWPMYRGSQGPDPTPMDPILPETPVSIPSGGANVKFLSLDTANLILYQDSLSIILYLSYWPHQNWDHVLKGNTMSSFWSRAFSRFCTSSGKMKRESDLATSQMSRSAETWVVCARIFFVGCKEWIWSVRCQFFL